MNRNDNRESLSNDSAKIKNSQMRTMYHYLMEHVATASMVAEATGIYQKNICRYKRKFEKANQLWEVRRTICQKTKFKAHYLTTDPKKAPQKVTNQLSLFP